MSLKFITPKPQELLNMFNQEVIIQMSNKGRDFMPKLKLSIT